MQKGIITLAISAFMYSCSNGQNHSETYNLSPSEFSKKAEMLTNEYILDVRSSKEFSSGHVHQAVNIDWNSDAFEEKVEALDKSKPVMVYCLSGGRSAAAAQHLREAGFETVYEMNGGMMSWRAENLPENSPSNTSSMNLKDFDKLITSDKLVLVDFYAEWCSPCKKMAPYLTKISEELGENVIVVKIDADKNQELCKQMNVTGLPVLKLYKNKELIWQNEGFVEEKIVREVLSNNSNK